MSSINDGTYEQEANDRIKRAASRPAMTYPPEVIAKFARDNGTGETTVTVSDGQTAWDPSSTKRVLYGPLTVQYVFHTDGAVDARVIA
jgi:hypothetical protein